MNEAITKAQNKYQEALKKQRDRRTNRPATPKGVIQFVNDLYIKYELGSIRPVKRTDRDKISGFIKLMRNNGYEDQEIYKFLEKIFDAWPKLLNIEMHTDSRKKYILDTRPNLIDIIHCKNQIFQELNEKEDDTPETENLLELWRSQR